MIPHNIIEDIKYRNPIEDVIASYVTLQRAGSNYKGLCPFHSEKTPSFTVFTDTPHFYCFGCGAGGDVISFIMRAENLDYPAAIEFLAKRCGVTLPENTSAMPGGVGRARVIEMNTAAARYFREILFDERLGRAGREYLSVKRGLSDLVIRHFGLGYAPDSFDSLRRHLRSKGFTDEEMTAGFLCARSKKNPDNIYDIFRNRVMFPIIDVAGNVVAFGGRVLDDSVPKYLNSSDTPAFKKSKNLFALNYARTSCTERLILCEGYMDVIALHAAGFENAVATLGTAITQDHARIIKRHTQSVAIAYDNDGAGQKAADKAIRLLDEVGISCKVIDMSGAKDPDEYIKKFGRASFDRIITESRTKFDYILNKTVNKYNLENADEKVAAAKEICLAISEVYSKVERDIYIAKAAKTFGIETSSMRHDIEGIIRGREKKKDKERRGELLRVTAGTSDRVNPDYAVKPRAARLEAIILGMMLYKHEYIEASINSDKLSADDFVTDLGRRLFSFITDAYRSGGFDLGMLSAEFSQEEVSRATKFLTEREKLSDNSQKVFDETVANLRGESAKKSGGDDMLDVINRRKKKPADGVNG